MEENHAYFYRGRKGRRRRKSRLKLLSADKELFGLSTHTLLGFIHIFL